MRRITVFSGSRPGTRPAYATAARVFGQRLVARGIGLVYGGASVGLMGEVAGAVLAAGGDVVGVIPRGLAQKEIAHRGLSQLHLVETMHERKAMMADLADGFVALPGGFGTLDELFEIVTWAQIGIHQKPIGLLDAEGFFAPLVAMAAHVVAEGFAPSEHVAMLLVDADPELLLDRMTAYRPAPLGPKWLTSTRET